VLKWLRSVVDVALEVLDDVVVAVDVQDSIFEVALELHPRPVDFRELGEYLVLRRFLLFLVGLLGCIVIIIGRELRVIMVLNELAAHFIDV